MRKWPLPEQIFRLSHLIIWSAILIGFTLIILGQPLSWAAPVQSTRNQTVPGIGTSIYLPSVQRADPYENLIEELDENGGFSLLLKTLEAANLTFTLEADGPFTLFAPTDAAFNALPTGALDQLLANPTGQLTQILLYHIVPGQYELDDLAHDMKLSTQQGSSITVERDINNHVKINNATILTPIWKANNGVIYAIDTVILPPPPMEVNEPVNAGSCGGDDGCKFKITGGPVFASDSSNKMKLQLFFTHKGIDDGQPQGDYHLAVERNGQLISTFVNAKSHAMVENLGDMGPYNYEAEVPTSELPDGVIEGLYYFWVLDGNYERDSEVFQMYIPSGTGKIWIEFDQS